jgi:hypothetical protein
VSEASRGFVFDLGACMCQNIKDPSRGSRYGGGEPVGASSEAEPCSRGHLAPERGGALLEGASSPRARRSLARGWLGPTVLVGRWGLQDRGPLFAIRDCLGVFYVSEFVYVLLFAKESGFSLVISGTPMVVPYKWLSPTSLCEICGFKPYPLSWVRRVSSREPL